ncbi:glycoside hydrolase family 15 [Sphingobacterium sp. G1-14]|uniref:glycoside hydrolase family 15 n=1 Tax=Sphingobacterium sp. G1-14 TaxID=2003121 RepID=UPI000B495EB3|nr:glycoside hydrolase family 15 [Sphingobacterium sp. G1-14]
MAKENLYDTWARRNPLFEVHFEEILLRQFTEYGGGNVESMTNKGKIFGAGYELYIYAFFVGLYSNESKELKGDTKSLGQPIQFWGNLESKKFRRAYPKIREYIFAALIARTDELDLLALEKGEITVRKAVDFLIDTMEKYANYGFHQIQEKLKENPNYFYKSTGFLDVVLDLVNTTVEKDQEGKLEEL